MLERQGKHIVFWCDGRCAAMLDPATDKVRQANIILKGNGWRIFGFKHYCPECFKLLEL